MKTKEDHIEAVQAFIIKNDREPTAIDFDSCEELPSARTIQRRYGGLPEFRELAGLSNMDFTKGLYRSAKAKKSMDEATKLETELFKELLEKYSHKNVSSPARVFADNMITADFRIDIGDTIYLVDVFTPNTTHSFRGCVNIKNGKYISQKETFYPGYKIKFLYVCTNEDVMVPVKNPIPILSLSQFKEKFL